MPPDFVGKQFRCNTVGTAVALPSWLSCKEPPANAGHMGSIPASGKKTLEKEMATHSNTLAWEIARTEEPGGLQSMGLRRSGTTEQLNSSCKKG